MMKHPWLKQSLWGTAEAINNSYWAKTANCFNYLQVGKQKYKHVKDDPKDKGSFSLPEILSSLYSILTQKEDCKQ